MIQPDLIAAERFEPKVQRYVCKNVDKLDMYLIDDSDFYAAYLKADLHRLVEHKSHTWHLRRTTPLTFRLECSMFEPLIFCGRKELYYSGHLYLSPYDSVGESPWVFEQAATNAGLTLDHFASLAKYQRSSHISNAIGKWLSNEDNLRHFESTYLSTQLLRCSATIGVARDA